MSIQLTNIYLREQENNILKEFNTNPVNAVITYKGKEDDKSGMGIYEHYSKKRTRRYYHI